MFSVVTILVPGQPDHYDRERQRPRRQHRKRPHRAAERNAIIVDSQSPKHRVLKLWSEAQPVSLSMRRDFSPINRPSSAVIGPINWLLPKLRFPSIPICPSSGGIGPLNRLPNRLRFSTPPNSPNSGGIGPLNWLPDKLKLRPIRPSSDVPYLRRPSGWPPTSSATRRRISRSAAPSSGPSRTPWPPSACRRCRRSPPPDDRGAASGRQRGKRYRAAGRGARCGVRCDRGH